ncbi:MAG: FecR domain-containing protein [Bacteroidota bacterium]
METNTTYYIDLITKYFFGEATPEEIQELEHWVKADPANRELFLSYRKTTEILGRATSGSAFNIEQDLASLRSKIGIAGEGPKVIPLSGSVENAPVTTSRSLILSWSLRVAAVFLLVAVPSFFLYRYLAKPAEMQYAAANQVVEVALSDGTRVTLNAGAILTCPAEFEGSVRQVTLKGEAWFEVSHNAARPFVIAAGDVRIRVVGTTFSVNTHTLSNTSEIILATGKVQVYFAGKPETMAILAPGDKAEAGCDHEQIIRSANDDPNFLAWKTKRMVFNNTPLSEAVVLLAKVYHTNLRIAADGPGDCRITTIFDKQSLESVLNVLKATLDLQIRNTGTGIELSGHGCR